MRSQTSKPELGMSQTRIFDLRRVIMLMAGATIAVILALVWASNAQAQDEEPPTNRVLSPSVGQTLQGVLELQDQENWGGMVSQLTPLLSQELTEYERYIILQLRGTARFQQDNLSGAIQDFLGMLNTGAATRDETNTVRVQVGQLYIATDNLNEGLRQLELAIANGVELNESLLRLLTQAYYQAERFRDGLPYAERYYRARASKTQGDFALMQAYYSELGQTQDELRVVRDSLDAFPGERRGWQNLVALFTRLDRDTDAFEANKLMYLNGLFEECNELFRLSQWYSFFENPYRGASILEREINAGRCEGNVDQLRSLANMWRQAREFDRAIPVLERLANQTNDGEWSVKLAEAHFELNNLAQAETAFEQALNRGGLEQTGTAWALLGTVRYQRGDEQGALAAYREAARFSQSRREANGWISFINTQIQGRIRRELQLEQVLVDECRLITESEVDIGTIVGQVDDTGQVVIQVEDRCTPYFNQYGDQIREAGMTDEEAAELAAEVAEEVQRRIEEIAAGRS
jgi:tetratricopeptide (TPR) repeat protein